MHAAHLAQGELVLILLLDEGHDHVLDELSLHLSKLHLTAYCAAMHLDRSCDHPCDNELRLLCAAQQFVELLGDHHHGTNGRSLDDHDLLEDGRYSDDHDPLEDDPLNHHDHTTDDHRDLHDQLTDGHYLDDHAPLVDDPLNHRGYKTNDLRDLRDLLTDDHDLLEDDPLNLHDHTTDDHRDLLVDDRDLLVDDRDLLVDDLLNHHGYTTDDHRDLLTDDHDLLEDDPLNLHDHTTDDHRDLLVDDRDLLVDDRDLGHHFARMQDDLLDDYLDGMGVRHDPLMDDHGLQLVCLNDRLRHQHRRDVRDAKVCRILLPVADDVDRDFLGLAPDEVYLQTTRKQRTYARCE
jgi:hypothetical protein